MAEGNGGTQADAGENAGGGEEAYRYAAFISYRHADADRRWAIWLHGALENYRIPTKLARERGLPRRVGRVFRDEEELPSSADLNEQIERALVASKFIIVICSPRTPPSRWVNREVERFREMGRHERILALLIEGEPDQSFPPALREIRRTLTDSSGLSREEVEQVEPLAADVRPIRRERRGHLGRMAKLRLLACVVGVAFDDLRRRDRERRRRRLRYWAAAALVVLAAMAGLLEFGLNRAALANQRKRETDEQTRIAGERLRAEQVEAARKRVAEVDALAAARRFDRAKAVGWQAYDELSRLREPTLPAEAALWAAYRAAPPPLVVLADGSPGVAPPSLPPPRNARPRTQPTPPVEPSHASAAALAPDGRTALVGESDGSLASWDVPTGRRLRTFAGHSGGVWRVAIAPDGQTALTTGADETVKWWDLAGADSKAPVQPRRTITGPPRSRRIAFKGQPFLSNRRAVLRTPAESAFWLFNLETGQRLRTAPSSGELDTPFSQAISPDGAVAASGGTYGQLTIWRPEGGAVVRTMRAGDKPISGLAFSPDGRLLAVAGGEGLLRSVRVLDVKSGEELRQIGTHDDIVESVAFTGDGRDLLSFSIDGTIRAWDAKTGSAVNSFGLDEPANYATGFGQASVSFSADGRLAVTTGKIGPAKVWALSPGRDVRTLRTAAQSVFWGGFTPDGRLAVTTAGEWVDVWDATTGRMLRHLLVGEAPEWGLELRLLSDGRSAVTRITPPRKPGPKPPPGKSGPEELAVLSLAPAGEQTFRWPYSPVNPEPPLPPTAGPLLPNRDRMVLKATVLRSVTAESPAFPWTVSADGAVTVAGRGDGSVGVYETPTGKLLRILPGLPAGAQKIDLSADGRRAVAAGEGGTCTVWDVQGGSVVATFKAPPVKWPWARLSPVGRTVLLHETGALTLRNAETGGVRVTLPDPTDEADAGAFSPDGRFLLTSGRDRQVRLWDAATGQPVRAIGSHLAEVIHVTFSPDGRQALSTAADHSAVIWDFTRALACRVESANLARARQQIRANPDAPDALAALGTWYAGRGMDTWAVEMLEKSRAAGRAGVGLTLARCYANVGRYADAVREYEVLRAAAKDEPERLYLQLCRDAVQAEIDHPDSTTPGKS